MIIAVIGIAALYALFIWLFVTIVCQYLSHRKGYGERWGLATGLVFPPGLLVWLFIPPKPDSDWKVLGPFGSKRLDEDDVAEPQTGRGAAGGAGPTGQAG